MFEKQDIREMFLTRSNLIIHTATVLRACKAGKVAVESYLFHVMFMDPEEIVSYSREVLKECYEKLGVKFINNF